MLCLRTAGAYAGRSVETEAAALKALLREQAAATQCEVDVWARRGVESCWTRRSRSFCRWRMMGQRK